MKREPAKANQGELKYRRRIKGINLVNSDRERVVIETLGSSDRSHMNQPIGQKQSH